MKKKANFINPSKGRMSLENVALEIRDYIYESPDSCYQLVIGSDSQPRVINGESTSDFVSAIVIHRRGLGGRYFWKRTPRRKVYSLKERMYSETLLSLNLAEEFIPLFNSLLNGKGSYELEIHIDVGRSGKTRDMIKELVGMVNGNGYAAKTKPESFGAFVIADRHT